MHRGPLKLAAGTVLAAAGLACWHWWPHVRNESFVLLGSRNEAGAWYGFSSGSGSILLPWLMQALTIGLLFWWHHQCGVDGCYRYARRTTAAGERACWRHHPSPRRTVQDIHHAHRQQLGQPEDGSEDS